MPFTAASSPLVPDAEDRPSGILKTGRQGSSSLLLSPADAAQLSSADASGRGLKSVSFQLPAIESARGSPFFSVAAG
jgi:hypothetical protein